MFDSPPVDREALARWIADRFPDVRPIDGEALAGALASPQPPFLLDVRSPAEQAVSTLPGAHCVADGAGAVARAAALPPDAPIVVYCAAGVRSAKAARALAKAGHGAVLNLEGGIFAWANADRALVANGRPTRRVHPSDDKWGVLVEASRHALAPDT
jgi:rhodanese-related sulfurtransferase